ncbi:MAG TPA: chloride channel protein [Tepidisphaeraceae bacterium]|jgi:CIC family chloride channel protein
MLSAITATAVQFRVALVRVLVRIGFSEHSFHVILAVLIGLATALAAVSFHGLIVLIRHHTYGSIPRTFLYGRGAWMLILIPAAGGLAVALFSRYIMREREGHGIVDVLESVFRSSGMIRVPGALGKIVTSAITIGSGGSAGAEGPIVHIGAGIASGIGQLFRMSRQNMPILIGCGSAAGISAIFNAPIGGLLFTLEVILRDFSLRTLTPLVIASVIANFATQGLFRQMEKHGLLHEQYTAIFYVPGEATTTYAGFDLMHAGHFMLLGIACGLVGVALVRLMRWTEEVFARLKIPRLFKPALGGAMLGSIGLLYVLILGHVILGRDKFIPFEQYEMPAFFGDGYGAVRPMLSAFFYTQLPWMGLLAILLFLCVAKIVGTCLTLGSGGAGGIIAPSLFLGAVTGGAVGLLFIHTHVAAALPPQACALVAMGAVLAAVVHAPLAAMLILFEVTRNPYVVLPGMLTTVVAAAMSQVISRDSIYTMDLRRRGVRVGHSSDLTALRRLTVEQVDLEPATIVRIDDPLQRVLDLAESNGTSDFVVYDKRGVYLGMVVAEDIKTALFQREAIPLLTAGEIMRTDLPIVTCNEDLASVIDRFTLHDAARLPVAISKDSVRVVGLISRANLMKRYQRALADA